MRYRVIQKFATRRKIYNVGDPADFDETRGRILVRDHYVVPDDSTGAEPSETAEALDSAPETTVRRGAASGLTGPSSAPVGGLTGEDTPQSSSPRGRRRPRRDSREQKAALES